MRKIISAIVMAISTYTKIPAPRLGEEDAAWGYRNALAAFPICAFPVAFFHVLILQLSLRLTIPVFVTAILITVMPLVVTGGIHLDGYMDVSDAISSYRSREKKIEIMKDPHVGAFAVLGLVVYLMLMTAVSYEEADLFSRMEAGNGVALLSCAALIFYLGRCASALGVILMPKIKSEGMASDMGKRDGHFWGDSRVRILIVQAAVGMISLVGAPLIFSHGIYKMVGLCVLAAMASVVFLFVRFAKREFGGINGDLAGYCLCMIELICLLCLTIVSFFFGGV